MATINVSPESNEILKNGLRDWTSRDGTRTYASTDEVADYMIAYASKRLQALARYTDKTAKPAKPKRAKVTKIAKVTKAAKPRAAKKAKPKPAAAAAATESEAAE